MTFLTVAPWLAWTLLGLTAAAITLIFFLRIQHRRVVVSSSLLWDRVLEKRRRRSWLEILRRILSLLIALAIGLSLAMVMTGAERGPAGGEARRVRIVIDNSVSMAALRSDGETRLERATAIARDLLGRGAAADTFTLMDRTGRVLVSSTREREAVVRALGDLTPTDDPLEILPARPGVETWLITDGVGSGTLPDDIRTVSVYEEADNAAVTAFEIRATPTDPFRYEAFLEVANFSPGSREVEIEIVDSRGVQFRRSLELESGGLYRNTFDLQPLQRGPLAARVRAAVDALALDDEAWAWLPRQRGLRLLLVAEPGTALGELLAAESHVELERVHPEAYPARTAGLDPQAGSTSGDAGIDGIVFVGWAPEEPPAVPSFLVAPPPRSWLPAVSGMVEEPGPPDRFASHPLLRYVDMHDLRVERAREVDVEAAEVLVAAGEVPLLLAGAGPARWAMTTFDLGESDLAGSLGFPILVSNLVEWMQAEPSPVRAGPGRVSLLVPDARITGPDGESVAARQLGDRVVFVAAEPGLYLAHGARGPVPVAVSAGSRAASAINASDLAAAEDGIDALPPHRALWPTLLGLAAALLLLEGLTYHRRVTV